jgi:hypothetical protein
MASPSRTQTIVVEQQLEHELVEIRAELARIEQENAHLPEDKIVDLKCDAWDRFEHRKTPVVKLADLMKKVEVDFSAEADEESIATSTEDEDEEEDTNEDDDEGMTEGERAALDKVLAFPDGFLENIRVQRMHLVAQALTEAKQDRVSRTFANHAVLNLRGFCEVHQLEFEASDELEYLDIRELPTVDNRTALVQLVKDVTRAAEWKPRLLEILNMESAESLTAYCFTGIKSAARDAGLREVLSAKRIAMLLCGFESEQVAQEALQRRRLGNSGDAARDKAIKRKHDHAFEKKYGAPRGTR